MRRFSVRRPSPALVLSIIALVVALGGTSYAAFSVPKNSVGTKQLKNASVTNHKLAKGAVGHQKLAANSVGTSNIQNGAVTSAKLGPGAVVNASLGVNSVTSGNIADGSVTTPK